MTFIISYIFKTKVNFIKSALYVFLYLILGTILSFGVYLIFSHDLTSLRNYYGFGAFLGITLVLLSEKKTIKSLDLIKNILICTFMYYILSFNFTYSSMLSYQKDAFEMQSIILASDLKNIVDHKKGNVFANKLFKDSPVFIISALNYPILYKLIDSNSVIYWPNNMRLNTYSGLNLNINFFDFSKLDASK